METIKHFCHRHRLTLHQQKLEEGHQKICRGCEKSISGDFYRCERCNFYICKSCLLFPMERIKHFSHRHRLTLHQQQKLKEGRFFGCKGCNYIIKGDFYSCIRCYYKICKSCFLLPLEIRHPFHREHPLTLLPSVPHEDDSSGDDSSGARFNTSLAYCKACLSESDGFIFHCGECKFVLDVKCATLLPTTNYYYYKASGQQTHYYYKASEQKAYSHPLIPCHRKNKQFNFWCFVCVRDIKGTIYVCLDCGSIMDESCTQLPLHITHQFHPHHGPLTLTDSGPDRDSWCPCKACGVKRRFSYRCYDCEFILDVRCASLMPQAIDDDQSLENHLQQVAQVPFTHHHDLIACDITTEGIFKFYCYACQLSIDGKVYVCLVCHYLLHKSCAQLPLEIKHPFHPQHPLVLVCHDDKDYNNPYTCKACNRIHYQGHKYWCGECEFELDVTCASLAHSTLKFELHHHPLAYFNYKKKLYRSTGKEKLMCSSCNIFGDFPFFRCVSCNFTIKFCCLSMFSMLPHTFKHSNHRHSLTLTYSFIKDHSDDDNDTEYYCDVCEKLRQLHEPTYYCENCHYVAHIECVFHEILPLLLGREWPLAPDEEIVILQPKVDALGMKIETLTIKLAELKEKRAKHIVEYQIGVTDAEIRNASADQNTFLSAASDDPAIVKLDKEIVMLQDEVDALTKKRDTLTTKLEEVKERDPQHICGYQIGSIPSLGRNMKKDEDEDEDVGAKNIIDDSDDQVVKKIAMSTVQKGMKLKLKLKMKMKMKMKMKIKSDDTFPTLAEVDQEIKAITKMLKALTKKRARLVSRLEFK